jgi:choline transport protein
MIYTYLGTVIGGDGIHVSRLKVEGSQKWSSNCARAPTSGGQYHWVSEFAPKSIQRFLSYIVGWICVLAWHTGIAAGGYVFANMLIGLLALNHDTYVAKPFHGTLIVIAVTVVCMFINTFFARKLPLIEKLVLILHICGFFAVLITLWVLSPRTPAAEVFGRLQDNGGWGSDGVVYLVGTVGPIYALLGADAAVHMSEEIRDSSRILPLGMMWTLAINGVTGFVMVVTFAFCVGDVEEVLTSSTGFPFIQVFYNATGSRGVTTALTCLIMVLSFCNTINNVATTSRQMYAFARDQALPFSAFLCQASLCFTMLPHGIAIPMLDASRKRNPNTHTRADYNNLLTWPLQFRSTIDGRSPSTPSASAL